MEGNTGDHRRPALHSRAPSSAIIHQHGSGMDLARETYRFEFPGVHIERRVKRDRFPHGNTSRSANVHSRRIASVSRLELSKDRRWNDNLLEKLGEQSIDAA